MYKIYTRDFHLQNPSTISYSISSAPYIGVTLVYKKKLNRFEIALNSAKEPLVSSFFMYIASLGTYKVE
jgi:hypothetical protein